MAGIVVNKRYISSSLQAAAQNNNWSVLVFGVTNMGPAEPTLVQTYYDFLNTFGQPVSGVPTHTYVKMLLDSGVSVLFKRITFDGDLTSAKYFLNKNIDDTYCKMVAKDNYSGEVGNKIAVKLYTTVVDTNTTKANLDILFNSGVVESFTLGSVTSKDTLGSLFYNFIISTSEKSKYVDFSTSKETNDWSTFDFNLTTDNHYQVVYTLSDGVTKIKDLSTACVALANYDDTEWKWNEKEKAEKTKFSSFWNDRKLKNASVYYPLVRFVSAGGITSDDKPDTQDEVTTQDKININLGKFVTDCKNSFRALIDYSIEKDITDVRNFIKSKTFTNTGINPSIYAYFGYWGYYDGIKLPGSAGFLSSLGKNGYNVYSRRIAGTSFSPAFTKMYKDIYIDEIPDWQAEDNIQVNPIVVIDAQDNLAVMGSSTLAKPLESTNYRNPAQALDICLVGDYITNILSNLAYSQLEGSINRLSLTALSSSMNLEIQRFVTSGAISRFDITFDTTVLSKLYIYCTLYFPIGLEEVQLTVTSVYDPEVATIA